VAWAGVDAARGGALGRCEGLSQLRLSVQPAKARVHCGARMNYSRIALAALGATVAYFVLGGILFGALPSLRKEFMKYPAVYRTQDDMKRVMPMGMISILVAIFVVAVLYAMAYPAGGGVLDGARFGALIGVFAVCGFALHNHMLLNIGIKLTIGQAITYFVQWLSVGIVISLMYAPAHTS
jgi:hypothetical protein